MAAKNQYQLNLEIEQFIKDKDSKKQSYYKADIDFIQQYEGSGERVGAPWYRERHQLDRLDGATPADHTRPRPPSAGHPKGGKGGENTAFHKIDRP